MKKSFLIPLMLTLCLLPISHNTAFAAKKKTPQPPKKKKVSSSENMQCFLCKKHCNDNQKAAQQTLRLHKTCLQCIKCEKLFPKTISLQKAKQLIGKSLLCPTCKQISHCYCCTAKLLPHEIGHYEQVNGIIKIYCPICSEMKKYLIDCCKENKKCITCNNQCVSNSTDPSSLFCSTCAKTSCCSGCGNKISADNIVSCNKSSGSWQTYCLLCTRLAVQNFIKALKTKK